MSLCVHVDDIIVERESEVCISLYASLLQEFQTTQGNLSRYLGFAFERDKAGGVLRISASNHRICRKQVWSQYSIWAPGIQTGDSWS